MAKEDLKLVIALTRSYHQLVQELSKNVGIHSLSLSEFGVLEFLYHKGAQSVQKIAEKILVTSGTMTYVINQLEKKGYVERKQCNEDLRIRYVALTEEGSNLMDQVFPEHERFVESLFSGLSNDEKQILFDALVTLQRNI
jgi:MarR family 2-MHQ and catechol resistance regulon transcriptional repressor